MENPLENGGNRSGCQAQTHDDTVNMLEKYSESAGKCDNNERKWCKKDRKMKETGKTLGDIINIEKVCMKMQETRGNGAKIYGGKR